MGENMAGSFEVQGHRGARGLFPENTVEGFIAAMQYKLDSIELDVAVTADGVAVVVHDPSLNPDITRDADGKWLAASGPAVKTLTRVELLQFDVGRARPGSAVARANPDQHGQDGVRIPTLAEVFAATQPWDVVVDVELKTEPDQQELTVAPEEMADIVLATAAAANATSRLAIRSFDWRGLQHVRLVAPQVKLAWLTGNGQDASTPAAVMEAASRCLFRPSWAPFHATLSRDMLDDAHARGLRVVPWTVNESADMRRLIEWGVDGICTDRPDRLRALLP